MTRSLASLLLALGSISLSSGEDSDSLKTETIPGEGVWIDPAIDEFPRDKFRITAWFEDQFLGDGEAYLRRTAEFEKLGRIELGQKVEQTLKSLSEKSQRAAGEKLDQLADSKQISKLEYHWIVNSFTCRIKREALEALKSVPGVRMIYFAGPTLNRQNFQAPPKSPESEPLTTPPEEFSADQYDRPWYVESLKADRVWKEHKVTGKGVLNVIHDQNFILSPNIIPNRYRNPKEEPNDKDDSGNGLIDDIHGYDFLLKRPRLTRTPIPKNGRVDALMLHGHQCVAIICGRGTRESSHQFGLAPESQWAGVLAEHRIEAAIEWAVEQGADTYSMSFSLPGLREYRSHWRKILEHGAYCGVHFVSGAGNFGEEGSPQFAPIPIQMRIPEDIPDAVFAAAGVKQDLSRTPFSSQGPVEWNTEHYRDGTVDKPEVGAFNYALPILLPDGKVQPDGASGNSFAGPMFCGTIALMLSANPDLKPWEVREIIIDTATDIGPEGYDHQTGHGLIDVFEAVSQAIARKKSAGR